ncbi:MAG: hypothetical protein NUV65_00860 [Candidatus Roizmanbacteria bacterium]|nr:hypothetical protein [Candidatus Roizmanbacteria bacterium]
MHRSQMNRIWDIFNTTKKQEFAPYNENQEAFGEQPLTTEELVEMAKSEKVLCSNCSDTLTKIEAEDKDDPVCTKCGYLLYK